MKSDFWKGCEQIENCYQLKILTITNLKIDLLGGEEPFEIGEIRFCPRVGMEMDGVMPTKPTEVVIDDASNIPDGITVTVTGGAKLEIVTDPADPTKKVFKVNATSTGLNNVYTYFEIYMHFEAGERYRISYKIMPLTDVNGNSYTNTIIGGNLIYGTTESGSSNHTFDYGSNKSTSSEWIQCTYEGTIPRKYSAANGDRLQIWGKFSPNSGCAISYLVSDIVIEVLE